MSEDEDEFKAESTEEQAQIMLVEFGERALAYGLTAWSPFAGGCRTEPLRLTRGLNPNSRYRRSSRLSNHRGPRGEVRPVPGRCRLQPAGRAAATDPARLILGSAVSSISPGRMIFIEARDSQLSQIVAGGIKLPELDENVT